MIQNKFPSLAHSLVAAKLNKESSFKRLGPKTPVRLLQVSSSQCPVLNASISRPQYLIARISCSCIMLVLARSLISYNWFRKC